MTTYPEQRASEIRDVCRERISSSQTWHMMYRNLADLQISKEVELLREVVSDLTVGCIEGCYVDVAYPSEHCKHCYTGKVVFKYQEKIKERS